jgi:hypothetical protein
MLNWIATSSSKKVVLELSKTWKQDKIAMTTEQGHESVSPRGFDKSDTGIGSQIEL